MFEFRSFELLIQFYREQVFKAVTGVNIARTGTVRALYDNAPFVHIFIHSIPIKSMDGIWSGEL